MLDIDRFLSLSYTARPLPGRCEMEGWTRFGADQFIVPAEGFVYLRAC
jgi:hypothetical protein